MIPFDWAQVIIGLCVGVVISTLYFAGLAYGMRIALRSGSPIHILSFSASLRIVILLSAGWFVTLQSGPWAFVGYGVAFFVVRFIATTVVRAGVPEGTAL